MNNESKFQSVLLSVKDGIMVFQDKSCVNMSTIRGRVLKKKLRMLDGSPRVGAKFHLFRNSRKITYLDAAFCYENTSGLLLKDHENELQPSVYRYTGPKVPELRANQFRFLATTIFSFVNARVEAWRLHVGYSDAGFKIGVQSEVPDVASQEEFESDFRYFIYNSCGSKLFSSSLNFRWEIEDGIKTLVISAPLWSGDLLLCDGTSLYIRASSTSVAS